MTKFVIRKRLPLICFCIGLGVFVPILTGCSKGAGGHEMTADDFKNKPMPPEARKAMEEQMKRAGTQANAPGAPQDVAPK